MTRTVGTARLVVAGIVLMGGAIGMFGDVQMASVNQVFPRVPRTEQEQVAGLQKDGEAPAARHDLSLVARGAPEMAIPASRSRRLLSRLVWP